MPRKSKTRLSHLLLGLVICLCLTGSLFREVKANPVPSPVTETWNLILAFVVSETLGFIVGTSILIFAAGKDREKAIWAVIEAMVVSYVIALILWGALFNSSALPGLTLISILVPEALGTVLGTIIIKKVLGTRWTWAFFTMGVLMLTSYFTAEFMYVVL